MLGCRQKTSQWLVKSTLTVMLDLIAYNIFSLQSTSKTTLIFYNNLMRLVGKEILHPLKGRRYQNPERPRNFPKLKFLLNWINQAESDLKLRSLTPSSLLSPSFPHFLSSFFTKCVSSFSHVLFPGLWFLFFLFILTWMLCMCVPICVCAVCACVCIFLCALTHASGPGSLSLRMTLCLVSLLQFL